MRNEYLPSKGKSSVTRMVIAATVFIFCLARGEGASSVATNDLVRLRVAVVDWVPLKGFHGSLFPASDVDPRFALTLRIDSCVPAIADLKSGTVVTFAVHSPSLFLNSEAEKGKTNEITMPRRRVMNLL